jgi:sec-independent protein translocase protein TatB
MIIIFIVALVFFGPEKLPELARNVGKFMAEFKRATGDFRSTFEDHLRELEREADQRRISQAAAAANAAAPPPAVVPQQPGTDSATPAAPVEGAVAAKAPWEQAADTAADAMSTSPHAQEPPETPSNGGPENTSQSAPDKSDQNSEPQSTSDHQPETTPEPPAHDDLLA